jgi:hypothetical protein
MPSETKLLRATVFELLIQTIVQRSSGSPDSSKVLMPNGGSNKLGVPVGVAVAEGEAVAVGVLVKIAVDVAVGVTVGVPVGVFVGVNTIKVAVDVLPAPPFVEVTVTLFSLAPGVEPSTSTEKVQDPLAGNVAPDRLTVEEPAVAVIVPPSQLPANPFGVATTRPAGNVSVKATPVNAVTGSELVIVKLRVVVSFNGMPAAPNDLSIEGGSITISVSVAGSLFVAPSLLVSVPGGIVLR